MNVWNSYYYSEKNIKQQLETQIHESKTEFANTTSDTLLLTKLLNKTYSISEIENLKSKNTGYYLYLKNDLNELLLEFWSKHNMKPENATLQLAEGLHFQHLKNGYFLVHKKNVKLLNNDATIIALTPVQWNYYVENKYLRNNFSVNDVAARLYKISDNSTEQTVNINDNDGKTLYKLTKQKDSRLPLNPVAVVFLFTSIIILFIFFNRFIQNLYLEKGFKYSLATLVITLILVRLLSYLFPFYRQGNLFDATVFASSEIIPSLGDLIINVVLIFWILTFIKFRIKPDKLSVKPVSEFKRFSYSTALLSFWVFTGYNLSVLISSLVTSSTISFNVTDFFTLSVYTVLSLGVIVLVMLSFYHFTHIILLYLHKNAPINLVQKMLIVAVSGLLFLSFTRNTGTVILNVFVLLWLLMFLYLVHKQGRNEWSKQFINSKYFVYWVIFFSIAATAVLKFQSDTIEVEQRSRFADKLMLQSDPFDENIINLATSNIDSSWLSANAERFFVSNKNMFIKDSIIKQDFAGYLNKFDTHIFTFDSLQHPLFNEDSAAFADIRTIILNQAKPTLKNNLYYHENITGDFSYLFESKIYNKGNIAGYFFMLVKPKRYKNDALYPELFKQDADINNSNDYSFAIYSKGKLISSENNTTYSTRLNKSEIPVLENEQRQDLHGNSLWIKGKNNKVIIVSKRGNSFIAFVTLFAYIFFAFLVVCFLYYVVRILLEKGFNFKRIYNTLFLTIRNQIHFTIIFVSLFSFIIIGIATISFFIIRFKRNNESRITHTLQVMSNDLENEISSFFEFNEGVSIYDLTGTSNAIEQKVAEISDIHNSDINLYDKYGNLVLSTQPYVYKKYILNDKLEPKAFYELTKNNRTIYLQNENIANISYLSAYAPLTNENNETIFYLNIPYLNSQSELKQEISNFLVTLINLNAFIFVIAGIIALYFAGKISNSLSIVSNKMRDVNLGKENEQIEWKRNDEIGALVNNYNAMMTKLEASAKALAKSEREGAWREMARQVAHEIKNPLTPMKLSIQHLQRSIENNSPNVKELSQRMANTLIEQIEQLTKIANDFSQFAHTENTNPENIFIKEILQSVANLHEADERVKISVQADNSVIFADKTQMTRLFTNIVKNAIEASNTDEICEVNINTIELNDSVLITVKDNGSGIPEEMREKIFTPNFTTKNSGTGLGLAICKAIVENANGKIWFETEMNKGTVFFIEMKRSN